jgi:dihydropteroate synthase
MNTVDFRHQPPSNSDAPIVMGILNVTPDSFSDGGRYTDAGSAVAHAASMIEDGAAIIDVGAESTRPGADPVPADVQIDRVIPVIERIRESHPARCISIDTQSAAVAQAALDAGADWVNDISALGGDARMAELVAERKCPVVLMHMQGTPRTMQAAPRYGDVVAEVGRFLEERIARAIEAGVARDHIVIDPGLGFGKSVEHNLELLRRITALVSIGRPVLVGASRKSFIGRTLGRDEPADRLPGSLACAAVAVQAGARIIRSHDVRATVDVVRMCGALMP